ncbi:MAG: histidine--tRNA ligase [Candidatus Omnitrophica bacterium]|nr:histidine--tRNA ligase [Candidatus Omnitrophota bacterium]
MAIQALRGTTDLFGDDARRWAAVEHHVKRLCRAHGYGEIRTPVIEDAALFLRTLGETTDIVQKEMFRFEDRGGHDIVLRPEGTASVVRAYLEHNLHKTIGFAKLFYLGPMFRAERPQAGRLRQFHQYGVEAIGSYSPWIDVEVILLCLDILNACGVTETTVWLSSMGCREDQQRSAAQLRERLASQRAKLCQECQKRFDKNVFRVLDCQNPSCHGIAWGAITGSPFLLCGNCEAHFTAVRQGLGQNGVAFDDTQVFARGLDYYTQTVFEVRAKGLGAQDAVAAGGRYNHLVEDLGGPALGAVGFAAGIERILMAQGAVPAPVERPKRHGVYLAVAQPALIGRAFQQVTQLRAQGVQVLMDYDGKSLKAQLREADKAGCKFVAILGEKELEQGAITLKDLDAQSQETVAVEKFAESVGKRTGHACH